jgi:hypothetical protein
LIQAMLPFRYIGKKIECKAQEGEDILLAWLWESASLCSGSLAEDM